MKSVVTKKRIAKYLTSPFDVEVFRTLKSSNLTAKEAIFASKRSNFVIVAREQTGGMGRFDRKFCSPKDCGAYFSAVITPKTEQIEYITPLCAVATANAIRKVCNKDAEIKWVNDIYVGTKKCVGILCEAVASRNSANIDRIVMGIGINLFEPKCGYDDEIKDIVGVVGEEIEDLSNKIIATTLDNIWNLLEHFDKRQIAKEYKEMSMLIGKTVRVCRVEKKDETAKVCDIDDKCRLVVEYEDKRKESLDGGEVSIKW